MQLKTYIPLALLLAGLCGCQTHPPAPKLETTRTFQKSFDQVWPVLVRTVSESDYPMKVVEKDSGVIETDNFAPGLLRGAASAPRGLLLPCWSNTRARLSILAQQAGTNTSVKVVGHFEAFEFNAYNQWFVWDSTGQFENQFLAKVESSLIDRP